MGRVGQLSVRFSVAQEEEEEEEKKNPATLLSASGQSAESALLRHFEEEEAGRVSPGEFASRFGRFLPLGRRPARAVVLRPCLGQCSCQIH